MSFSLAQILLFIIAYLSALFAVAMLADRGVIPARITHHPAVYVLSLGVFGGAMASNGVIALSQEYGYNFLLYYLGVVLMFVLAAVLLMPLLRLCRVYQLSSMADVLTFRYRSPWVGAAVTLAMCITLLPLLALQIQAVAESIDILSGGTAAPSTGGGETGLALLFVIIITVFSILFGTRHVSSQRPPKRFPAKNLIRCVSTPRFAHASGGSALQCCLGCPLHAQPSGGEPAPASGARPCSGPGRAVRCATPRDHTTAHAPACVPRPPPVRSSAPRHRCRDPAVGGVLR